MGALPTMGILLAPVNMVFGLSITAGILVAVVLYAVIQTTAHAMPQGWVAFGDVLGKLFILNYKDSFQRAFSKHHDPPLFERPEPEDPGDNTES